MEHIATVIESAALSLSETPSILLPASECPPPAADVCRDCNGAGWLRQEVPPSDPRFGHPVRCSNPIHDPERRSRIRTVSRLGPEDSKRRLLDIAVTEDNEAMVRAAQEMIINPWGWLYIHGSPGNAKTEVLIAIVNELNASGRGPATFTTLGNILEWMRQAYSPASNTDYMGRFNLLKSARVLAIDEMDKPRETEWVMDFRFHFLDERYRSALNGETVTIFAGNADPATFDDVLYDRIRDGRFKIVHNMAPSARPHMQRGLQR